jgi:hypothetical protein
LLTVFGGVAERHEDQELREVEHLVAEAIAGEHHPHALPAHDDGGECKE